MAISTCCGLCSLRAGTIVIGVLKVVFGILALIPVFIFMFSPFQPDYLLASRCIGGGLASYIFIIIILAILLVIGADKRKVHYIFPSVFLDFGHILLSIGGLISIIITFSMTSGTPGALIFLTFFCVGIGLSFQIYFWLITFFFYQKLITEQRELSNNRNNHPENDQTPLTY